MKYVLAKSAGFCMGVMRAIAIARKAATSQKATVHTFGPLIHNPQELGKLGAEGILPFDEKGPVPHSTVIVRAHGVTPTTMERLVREAGEVIDATCPKVSSIQKRIREFSEQGYAVVIAGESDHPEVVGLLGYAVGKAFVIKSAEEVDELPVSGKVLLVSQTTQDDLKYNEIKERFLVRFPEGHTLDTICSSTQMRQAEIREMVKVVDAMLIIGGRNSANTRRLQSISQEAGRPSFHIESVEELPTERLKGLGVVGITAGASTPDWIIREVVEAVEKI